MGREALGGLDLKAIQVIKDVEMMAKAQTEKDLEVRVEVLLAKYPEALMRVQLEKEAKELKAMRVQVEKEVNDLEAVMMVKVKKEANDLEAVMMVEANQKAKNLEVQMATKKINQIKALRNLNKMSIITNRNNF